MVRVITSVPLALQRDASRSTEMPSKVTIVVILGTLEQRLTSFCLQDLLMRSYVGVQVLHGETTLLRTTETKTLHNQDTPSCIESVHNHLNH